MRNRRRYARGSLMGIMFADVPYGIPPISLRNALVTIFISVSLSTVSQVYVECTQISAMDSTGSNLSSSWDTGKVVG
jgi:hypothetical protein